jgi:hypothetical protein
MNQPIGEQHKNKYSCVYDGGCLEHVFNYPQAIKNCMEALAVGGHLILHTPANNYFGHGFYQFSAELFYSLLCQHNGFDQTKVFLEYGRYWREVVPPSALRSRVDICPPHTSGIPLLAWVISKKIAQTPVMLRVLQSDYETIWNDGAASKDKSALQRFIDWSKKNIPDIIRLRGRAIVQYLLRWHKRRQARRFYIKHSRFPR